MSAEKSPIDQAVPALELPVDADARRNALIYSIAQAINGSVQPVCFSVGALTGYHLLGDDKSFATLPVAGYTIGVALGAIPAAMLMRRVGRRLGFVVGSVIAIVAGLLATFTIFAADFFMFVVAMTLIGVSGAFVQQYRFAAADSGGVEARARAISWVLAGGVLAAVIGPQTVIHSHDLFDPVPFAGTFLALSVLAAIGLVVLLFLCGDARSAPEFQGRAVKGRAIREIAKQPQFIVAVICATSSFSLMSIMMTAAPLAMVAIGLGMENAAWGIQWHVLAMFGPSFVTGPLIARFGKESIIAAGMLLLAAGALIAIAGVALMNFWIAMIFLGVGWNFSFIGATTMLTESYRPEERSKVQGVNDFIVFTGVAIATFSSGQLLSKVGWAWLNFGFFPIIGICLVALAWLYALRPRMRRM